MDKISITDLFRHFSTLAKRSGTNNETFDTMVTIPLLDDAVSLEEVDLVLRNLSNSSSRGNYPIPTDVLKLFRTNLLTLSPLTATCDYVYQTGYIPPEWTVGTLIPVLKSGKDATAANCRPIEVLPLAARVISAVIARRLELWAGLHDDQAGFRPGRSTTDQLLIVQALADKFVASSKPLYAAFLDFSDAFITVNHAKLWRILLEREHLARFFNICKIRTKVQPQQ